MNLEAALMFTFQLLNDNPPKVHFSQPTTAVANINSCKIPTVIKDK